MVTIICTNFGAFNKKVNDRYTNWLDYNEIAQLVKTARTTTLLLSLGSRAHIFIDTAFVILLRGPAILWSQHLIFGRHLK